MDNMQVIGGIKAEIKTEVQDSAVEITLEDIVKNDSAVEMTLKDIIKNDSDSEGDPVDATGAGNGFLQANQFENLIHDLGDEANARHNFKAQGSNKIINNGIGKNNLGLDTGVQKAVNNDKDPEIPETLCLNYGLSDELFSSNKENENQTINTENDDIPLSRLYSTNEETSIKMDMEKVKVTNQPTSYFRFQGVKFVFKTDNLKYLKQHLTSTHRVEADLKYQCDKCDYKTNENLSLQRHKSQHLKPEEIKVFTCYHCKVTSTIRRSFRDHVQRHFKKNEVTFQCYICDFTTKKRDILMNHIVEKHSKEAVKDMDGVQKNNEETCDIPSSKPGLLGQDPLPHLTTHTGDKADSVHRCDKCDYKTNKSNLFQEHELLHLRREEFQLFICYHCNFTSTSRDTFRRHILRHFTKNEVTFQCYICDFTTMKRDILTVHILETHSKEAVKDMEINNGVQKKNKETEGTALKNMLKNVKAINPPTVYKEILANEYTQEGIRKFRCNRCHKLYKYRSKLFQHIRDNHRDVTKIYQCPYCPFTAKYGVKSHLISMHLQESEIEWFKCDQCDHKSKFKRNLQHHKLSHLHPYEMIDKMVKCDKCSKMYKTRSILKSHIKLTHERHKLKRKKCTECNSEFVTNTLLKDHMTEKHSNTEDLEILRCTKCSYTTKFRRRLGNHMSAVHGTVFQCEKCGYQTNRVYTFQIHKLNHLKPEEIHYFYCHHCDFKAKRKDNLKTHVLRHFKKNEVPFRCYICKFTTKRRNLLTNHIKNHSKGASINEIESEGDMEKEIENTIKKVNKGQERNGTTRVTPPVVKPLKRKREAASPPANQSQDVDDVKSKSFDATTPGLQVASPSDVATNNHLKPEEILICDFTSNKRDIFMDPIDKHSKGEEVNKIETDEDTMKKMENTTKEDRREREQLETLTSLAAKPLKQKREAASPTDNQSEDVE